VTIELVVLPASVVLGIVHITIMSHLQARKGLAIGHVGGNRWQRVIENAAALNRLELASPRVRPGSQGPH
jgi:hypothetical protein